MPTNDEAEALSVWYQRRYHEMVQNEAFQERTIADLRARVEGLERLLKHAATTPKQ